MKRALTLLTFAIFGSFAFAQVTTIPNMSLEDWDSFTNYDQPAGGYWETANRVRDLGSFYPVTTTRSTDAHVGTYSAKMVTDEVSLFPLPSLLVTGTLTTGEFDETALPPDNMQFGKPYTGTPTRFKGWYKFTSVAGDSAEIYTRLFKWNGSARELVAEAYFQPMTTVSTWTAFDIEFTYSLPASAVDTIVMVFASSSAGDVLEGQVGNTLYIDGIELEFTTGISDVFMSEIKVETFPNPASERMVIKLEEQVKNGSFVVVDMNGRVVLDIAMNETEFEINVSDFAAGTYHYVIREGNQNIASGKFLVNR